MGTSNGLSPRRLARLAAAALFSGSSSLFGASEFVLKHSTYPETNYHGDLSGRTMSEEADLRCGTQKANRIM